MHVCFVAKHEMKSLTPLSSLQQIWSDTSCSSGRTWTCRGIEWTLSAPKHQTAGVAWRSVTWSVDPLHGPNSPVLSGSCSHLHFPIQSLSGDTYVTLSHILFCSNLHHHPSLRHQLPAIPLIRNSDFRRYRNRVTCLIGDPTHLMHKLPPSPSDRKLEVKKV